MPANAGHYVTERLFAYNNRKATDLERVRLAMGGTAGRRVIYSALIS